MAYFSSGGKGENNFWVAAKKKLVGKKKVWYTPWDEFPHLVQARSDRTVVSSMDGPERGRETEAAKGGCFKSESKGSRVLRTGEA